MTLNRSSWKAPSGCGVMSEWRRYPVWEQRRPADQMGNDAVQLEPVLGKFGVEKILRGKTLSV